MTIKNSLIYINQFFFFISNQLRKVYLTSRIYNKRISKINLDQLVYKPSPSLLDCIIKYSANKINISEFKFDKIWSKKDLKEKDFKNLHNFFWLFMLDLKSPTKEVQSVISNWIDVNENYSTESWNIETLSKRIISWISNSKITYENSDLEYKKRFDRSINKQINHLINEIERSKLIDNQMVGCSAIILSGLAYNDKKKILNYGIDFLKKIIKYSFQKDGFPKSRNIRQLNFYLKYFILIREWLKESQNDIPEYLDEIIFYLGQAYSLVHKNVSETLLFNGSHLNNNTSFENYIKRLGYNFKNEHNEIGGYVLLKNNKYALAMDIGSAPEKNFSRDYQAGALSFELISNKRKIITNSGYFQKTKHQLNFISKTTACQSTLSIQNHSSVQFTKHSDGSIRVNSPIKINNKKIISNKDYWSIEASHDGYNKRFGITHMRKIDFFHDTQKLVGIDRIQKKNNKSYNFEIRFHLIPETKIMKTQDNKTIYIDVHGEGWRFNSKNCNIDFETGLYFGLKNNFAENQNIVISGIVDKNDQEFTWELSKI